MDRAGTEFSDIRNGPSTGLPADKPASNEYVEIIGSSPKDTADSSSPYAHTYDNGGVAPYDQTSKPNADVSGYEKPNYDNELKSNEGLYETIQHKNGADRREGSLSGSRFSILSRKDVVVVRKCILLFCACAGAVLFIVLLGALVGVAVTKEDCQEPVTSSPNQGTTAPQTGGGGSSKCSEEREKIPCDGVIIEGVMLYHVQKESNYDQLMSSIEDLLQNIDAASAFLGAGFLRLTIGHMAGQGLGLTLPMYEYPQESLVNMARKIPYYHTGTKPNVVESLESASEFIRCNNAGLHKLILVYTEDRHSGATDELQEIVRKLGDDGIDVVPIGVRTPNGTINAEQLRLMSTSGKYFLASDYNDMVNNVSGEIGDYLLQSLGLSFLG